MKLRKEFIRAVQLLEYIFRKRLFDMELEIGPPLQLKES
jgi:hypothetical protein